MDIIPVGRVGRIVGGEHAGKFVKVIDDSKSTGGFLIITSNDSDFSLGFDDWVENKVVLERYFREMQWRVEWSK